MPAERYEVIDSCRGIAALSIFLIHSGLAPAVWEPLRKIVDAFPCAVQFFFVISGFTLAMSIERSGGDDSWVVFMIRRYVRLWPMYFVGICLCLMHTSKIIRTWKIWVHVLMLHGFSPYTMDAVVEGGHSIGAEVVFYFVCQLLYKMVSTAWRNHRGGPLVVLAGIFTYCALVYPHVETFYVNIFVGGKNDAMQTFSHRWFPNQLPCFLFGFCAFLLLDADKAAACDSEDSSTGHDGRRNRRRTAPFEFLLGISIALLLYRIYNYPVQDLIFRGPLAYGLCFSLFIYASVELERHGVLKTTDENSTLFRTIFRTIHCESLRFFGKISYSVYILHFYMIPFPCRVAGIMCGVEHHFFPWVFRMLVQLALVTLVSWCTFRYIETPSISIVGRRLIAYIREREVENWSKLGIAPTTSTAFV
mmetsp:Transcript_15119/g.54452  ORF Transcript_15119/g.54452 Transcript_15119/m.54452 type:complete len:418 (+) Transcript_15119:232-1485(+)